MQESIHLTSGTLSINLNQAVILAKQAIDRYVESSTGEGTGKHRAIKLKNFLKAFPVNKDYSFGILGLFIALYGEPTFLPRPGRSSMLAGMIASAWITGAYRKIAIVGRDIIVNTNLSSQVFPTETLERLTHEDNSLDTSMSKAVISTSISTFNPTKGIRVFCQLFIKNLSLQDKAILKKLSQELKRILNNGSEDLEIGKLIPLSSKKAKIYVEAGLKGAFETSKEVFVSQLANDTRNHIASFLTPWDVYKSLRGVNRTADLYAQKVIDDIATPAVASPSATQSSMTIPLRESKISVAHATHFKPADQKLSDVFPKSSLSSTSESTQNLLLFLETYFGEEIDETRLNENIIAASVIALEKLAIKNQAEDIELIFQHRATLERATNFLNDFLSFQEFPFKTSAMRPIK